MVSGEGLLDRHLLHNDERTAIDEGPRFVGAVLAEFPGGLVDRGIDVDTGDVGILTNDVDMVEDARSR